MRAVPHSRRKTFRSRRSSTNDLRDRAKTGTGTQLAPNSDKELIDEKLMKSCDSEALPCMLEIGRDVGGDFLLYGRLTKRTGGYNVSLVLLDVAHGAPKRTLPNFTLPLGTTGNDLLEKARQMYANVMGEKSTGTLVVRLATGDHGTILIDRAEKGTITAGTGQITGLDEGKHKLRVEAEGYHPSEQDITISSGGETKITITLEKKETTGTVAVGTPSETQPTPGNNGGGGSSEPASTRGSGAWKGAFVGGAAVTLASAGLWIYGYEEIQKTNDRLCLAGALPTSSCSGPHYGSTALTQGGLDHENSRGDSAHTDSLIGGIGVGVVGAFTLVALYQGFIAKHEQYPAEHASTIRKHRERFVVTPIASPTGAGVRIDW